MRHRIVLGWIVAVAVLAACGTSVPTPATSPSPFSGPPVIDCLGGLDEATCNKAATVVLRAVARSGWTPTHVWLNTGSLAPIADLLFDPNANFPGPAVPEGGTFLGNAEVAFAENGSHAGINLATVGSEVVADLIGYRVPHPGWCSGSCPQASTTDGAFRLELVSSRTDWKAGEPIGGSAILSFDGAAPITIYGSGSSVINFTYAEVGGSRTVGPVWTADCAPHPLDPATAMNQPLSKSGAYSGDGPAAEFVRTFLEGPDVRLPAGTWDITAFAWFREGEGCVGAEHKMSATLRITVGD